MNRALFLALSLVAASCSKKSEEATTPVENSPVASAPAPAELNTNIAAATPEPAPVVDVESLPVEEQFEQEAEKDLTPQNLVAKLDEIEKEIGSP
ncbi:MAG: hypothetical protein M3020_02420 [Myxococcota bacterium]|jgi:hypothetical protein|nr:hypothetical protein [Myxococcota bacterium]